MKVERKLQIIRVLLPRIIIKNDRNDYKGLNHLYISSKSNNDNILSVSGSIFFFDLYAVNIRS